MVAAQGLRNVGELIAIVRDDGDTRLPDVARQVLQVLANQIEQIETAVTGLERQLLAWHKTKPVSQRLASITKRGNRYLRRLLINGSSANLLRSKATKADPWVIGLRRRRPPLVVAVALANKTARIAWAVMLREKEYQPRAMAA